MSEPRETKWYYGVGAVLIALACFGPLALPLLALSPKFSKPWKAVITLLTIALTVWLVIASGKVYNDLVKSLNDLKQVYGK